MEPKMMRLMTAAKLELLCACFVLLSGGSLLAQQDRYDNGMSAGGKWTEYRAEDPMTGAQKVRFELPAENTAAGDEQARIILYCTNGKLKLADFRPNVPLARPNWPGFWGQPQMRLRVRADNSHRDKSW